MEITEDHLVGIVITLIGLAIIITGKIKLEYGLTGPDKSNGSANFIASKKSNLTGLPARFIGFLISIIGTLIILYLKKGDVVFIL